MQGLIVSRRLLILVFALFTLASLASAHAQGTIQFNAILTGANEVPPKSDLTIGTATFTLEGNSLSYFVYVPALTFLTSGGTLNGLALPGANGPVIFDLAAFIPHSGSSFGDPPFYSSGSSLPPPFGAGPFTLSDEQIGQLESGRWYVNIASGPQLDGQLRGQILPVPEPSTVALLGLGAAGLAFLGRKRYR